MMKKEVLKKQSTKYLKLLETWYLLRWKRRLGLLNEANDDLQVLRGILDDRERDSRKD